MMLLFSVNCYSGETDYIPKQAYDYRSDIVTSLNSNFSDIPHYNYLPSLIEHESCISLAHSKCWNPRSRLKTSREEGAGLGQLTRAYNDDGSLRFDALDSLKKNYPKQLAELSWGNVYVRPDLQITAMTLMIRDTYKRLYTITDVESRLHMTDAAYNGGERDLQKERRTCGLAANCDPGIWFNNVERYCVKSKKALYGNRSACDINRYHVRSVFISKLPKYKDNYIDKDYITKNNLKGVTP